MVRGPGSLPHCVEVLASACWLTVGLKPARSLGHVRGWWWSGAAQSMLLLKTVKASRNATPMVRKSPLENHRVGHAASLSLASRCPARPHRLRRSWTMWLSATSTTVPATATALGLRPAPAHPGGKGESNQPPCSGRVDQPKPEVAVEPGAEPRRLPQQRGPDRFRRGGSSSPRLIPPGSHRSGAGSSSQAALTRPMWLKAWGRLPSSSPHVRCPRCLSAVRPASARAWTSQKVQGRSEPVEPVALVHPERVGGGGPGHVGR
ncbi:hypothetical protein BH10ACT10_BH10ACT10_00550 [soil metagenome]